MQRILLLTRLLFSDGPKDRTRPYLKFSINSKEALSKYKESICKQLQNDYTKVCPNYPASSIISIIFKIEYLKFVVEFQI